jgi:hypothetical protein
LFSNIRSVQTSEDPIQTARQRNLPHIVYRLQMLSHFSEMPQSEAQLTDAQKFFLYFGAADLAWFKGVLKKVEMPQSAEDSDKNASTLSRMVNSRSLDKKNISELLYEELEISLLIDL